MGQDSAEVELLTSGYDAVSPKLSGRTVVSRGGGPSPLWSPDGRELFYLSLADEMTVAAVETGDASVSNLSTAYDARALGDRGARRALTSGQPLGPLSASD